MLNLRNGIVITGSIGCGKSTVIQMCCDVLNKIRTIETDRIIKELREKAGKEPKQVNDPEQTEDELTEARKQLQHHGCQTYNVDMNLANTDILWGSYEEGSGQFREGFVYNLILSMSPDKLEGTKIRNCIKWIILHGVITPENSSKLSMLLEDEMQLILMNRATISLNPQTTVFMEADELSDVEPAFLSRVGLIAISEGHIDPKSIF